MTTATDGNVKVLAARGRWFSVDDPENELQPYRFLCVARTGLELAVEIEQLFNGAQAAQEAGDSRLALELSRRFAGLVLLDWNVYEPGEETDEQSEPIPVKAEPTADNYITLVHPTAAVSLLNQWFEWFQARSTVAAPLGSGSNGGGPSPSSGSPTRIPASRSRTRRST